MNFSSGAMIDGFEQFNGAVIDLTRGTTTDGNGLRAARDILVSRLSGQSLLPGEAIVLCVANGPRFFSALFALLQVGAAPILMHSASPARELLKVARRWGARFLLSDEIPELDNAISSQRIEMPGLGACVWSEFDETEPRGRASLRSVPLHPTSGTTGDPKLAVRPGDCALAEGAHYVDTLGISSDDTILCTTPLSHAYAYGMCFVVPLLTSARVLTMESFTPRLALRAIREHAISLMAAVPAMYEVFLRVSSSPIDTPLTALSAGAALPESTARRCSEKLGITIRSLYGTTETGGISIADGSQSDGVGHPMDGVEARLRPLDAEAYGREIGMLQIRSSSMMAGYLSTRGLRDSVLDDGWFETGDLAEVDAHGAIHLLGRESEFVNVFGMKVDPAEVEATISTHDQVEDVKVYAGHHDSGSEAVFAAILAKPPFSDAEEIRRLCQSNLAAFKCPTKVVFLDELPRSPSGKILRRQLPGSV